jgi:fibronectin-binding autotransporter adhesin
MKHSIQRLSSKICFALVAVITFSGVPSAYSTDRTWSGGAGTDASWTRNANWGGAFPSSTDNAVFTSTVGNWSTPTLYQGNTIVNITYDNGAASFNITQSGAQTLTLNGNITVNSANAQTISVGTLSISATRTVNAASGNLTISAVISGAGGLTKTGTGTLLLTGANTYAGLTTVSAGILTLGHATDTMDGAIQVDGGTLDVDNPDTVGAVTLTSGTISGDSTLTGTSYTMQSGTVSAVLAGAINLSKTTAGTVTMGVNHTYTGKTIVTGGTLVVGADLQMGNPGSRVDNLQLGSGGTLRTTAGFTLNANRGVTLLAGVGGGVFAPDSSTTLVVPTIIAGVASDGGLVMNGAGTLQLTATCTYTGPTVVSAGTLLVGKVGSTDILSGSTAVNVNGGILNIYNSDAVGAVTLTSGSIIGGSLTGTSYEVQSGTASAPLAGSVNLTKTTAGTVSLTGLSSYTGTTWIKEGTVIFNYIKNINTTGNFGTAASAVKIGDGASSVTMVYNGSTAQTSNRPFDFSGTTGTITIDCTGNSAALRLQAANTTTGAGAKTIILTGTSTLANEIATIVDNSAVNKTSVTKDGVGTWLLTAANTYSGDTRIVNGTLQLGPTGTARTTVLQNSCLDMNAADTGTLSFGTQVAMTFGSLKGTRDLSLQNTTPAAVALTVGNNNASDTYSGVLSGTGGALIKTGSGTFTLDNANTYTGNTTVSAGTLLVNSPGSLAAGSAVSVGTGATAATLGGSGTVNGTVTVGANGTLSPGASIGTLTLGAPPSLGGTLAMEIDGDTLAADKLAVTGTLTWDGSLTVTHTGTLGASDSFTLATAGGFSGWFSSVSLPSLASGLSWDTNHLATAGVLDVYSFSTTPLTLSTRASTGATVGASKLASHANSGKAASAYPTGWAAAVTTAAKSGSTVVVNGDGSLTYTPGATATADGNDSFTLTLRDGHGAQTLAVSVTVNAVNAGPTLTAVDDGNGHYKITTSGMPNQIYDVQAITDGVGGWQDIGDVTAAANGVVSWTDPDPIIDHTSRIYRLAQQ